MSHEADAEEAEDHHCPGRGLRDGGGDNDRCSNREASLSERSAIQTGVLASNDGYGTTKTGTLPFTRTSEV